MDPFAMRRRRNFSWAAVFMMAAGLLSFVCWQLLTRESRRDNDGDGLTERQGDCDDSDASVYPGAPEELCDGRDNDCDGRVSPTESGSAACFALEKGEPGR